jgi:hypothetical protein
MTDKRKRAAPTIDLTATEVPPAQDGAPAPDSAQAEASPPEPPKQAREAEPESSPREDAAREDAPMHEEPPRRRSNFGATLMAGIAGAVVAAGVLAVVWFAGLLSPATVVQDDQGARIAALQKQIEELQNRPPPPAADTQAVDALRRRLAKIESDMAQLPPGDKSVAERLAAADNAMQSLGIALTALNRRSDDIAAKVAQAQGQAAAAEKAVKALGDSVQTARQEATGAADSGALDAMRNRLAALEGQLTAARQSLAQTITQEIAKATDPAARFALTAAALRDAVLSGAPYQAELVQVKALGADGKAIAPLEPFAVRGVPAGQVLAQELEGLLPAMLKAAGADKQPGGFFERLQANAGRLVRVSPVNAPPGDKPAHVLARIEAAAAQGEIGDALSELAKLPAPVRAPAQAWIEKATSRQAALAAARRLAADAARALARQ